MAWLQEGLVYLEAYSREVWRADPWSDQRLNRAFSIDVLFLYIVFSFFIGAFFYTLLRTKKSASRPKASGYSTEYTLCRGSFCLVHFLSYSERRPQTKTLPPAWWKEKSISSVGSKKQLRTKRYSTNIKYRSHWCWIHYRTTPLASEYTG